MKHQVLAIVGPTAVGKTDLSLRLAEELNGEIISGDALQVYRGLDIGTAKATPAERRQIPHHLIDIRDVDERYSAYDFQQEAQELIEKISAQGKLPIIVGGTGFYLAGLLKNWSLGGRAYNEAQKIRNELYAELEQIGPQKMWQRLAQLDPIAAAKIPVNNHRRIIRALEVIKQTGGLFSKQQQEPAPYDALVIGLTCPRDLLYQRINYRVKLMFTQGLPQEAAWLFDRVDATAQSAKGIGYREWVAYFAGEKTQQQVLTQIQRDSRHYAKRQLTYFRHQLPTQWFDLLTKPRLDQLRLQRALQRWQQSAE